LSPPLKVGLLGLGGVAQGLLELWSSKPDPRFRIVWATDSEGVVHNAAGLDPASLLGCKRGAGLRTIRSGKFEAGVPLGEVRSRFPCDIVVNLLPCNYQDGSPGLPVLRAALEEGTHVVTAEKASIVLGFEALRRSAQAGRAHLRYSACVGGSVPFIPILEWVSQANEIRKVTGVLNATTTYILSELEARRHSSKEILEKASTLGILERDPKLDLEGFDLAAKAVLVHNTIYKELHPWNRVDRRGITEFLDNVDKLRLGTRLVATIEPNHVKIETQVLPMHSPLRVYGFENAMLIDTPNAGELQIRGVGAGGRGTATNVYGDLVRVAQLIRGGETAARSQVSQAALHPHV
jgi:homoserine dehydrogenase